MPHPSLYAAINSGDLVLGVVLLCFVLIVGVTIYGLLNKDKIDPKFMKSLVGSVLVMTAGAVLSMFKNINVNEDAHKLSEMINDLRPLIDGGEDLGNRNVIAGVLKRIDADEQKIKGAGEQRDLNQEQIKELKEKLEGAERKLAKIRDEKQKFIDYLRRLDLELDSDFPTAKAMIDAMFNSTDLKDAFISQLKNRDFYCIEQPEYVEKKIRHYSPEHVVSLELLELLQEGEGPFVPQRKKIMLSVPADNKIPDGKCVVRTGGPFVGKMVKISADPMNPDPEILIGAQLHEAPPDDSGAELIQVNAHTAKKIMGIDVLPSKSEAWAKSYPQ